MNRKSRLKRNLGGTTAEEDPRFSEPFFDGPGQAELRTSIVFPERLLRKILIDEVDRLAANEDELRRFFTHFFDPTISSAERESYVQNFKDNPPRTTIGYPRSIGDWPIYAITLTSDEESDSESALARYVGETLPGENAPGGEDAYYEGGFFDQSNAVLIASQHPDQTLYLYHFAKLALFGAREAIHNAGMLEPHFGGAELSPQELYLPDNVFARVLNISFKTMVTVPKLYSHRDGRRLRVTGIFGSDIVVDGMRGGVTTYETDTTGDDDNG